jgi:hypothetical protein
VADRETRRLSFGSVATEYDRYRPSPPPQALDWLIPPGTPLSPVEQHTVEFSLPMTKDELIGLLGTYSGVITLDPERRAEFSRRVRAFLDRQPWDRTDLPLICRCLRSRRLAG